MGRKPPPLAHKEEAGREEQVAGLATGPGARRRGEGDQAACSFEALVRQVGGRRAQSARGGQAGIWTRSKSTPKYRI